MFQHYKQTNVHKSVFTFSLTIPVDTVHSQSKAFDFETKILHETYILMPNKLQKITFKLSTIYLKLSSKNITENKIGTRAFL